MITNIDRFRKINESCFDQVKTRLDKSAKFCFVKGDPGAIADFLDSLNDESKIWVKKIDDSTLKIFDSDEALYAELLFLAEDQFDLYIEDAMHLNRREIKEGFGDKVSPARLQKKVDEVNALIAAAIDTDGDPIGVIDTSGTWQAEMKYKPVIYKNGFVYIQYDEQGERLPKKERFKPSDSYDAYQTLSQIATLYRRAIKKHGIVLPIAETKDEIISKILDIINQDFDAAESYAEVKTDKEIPNVKYSDLTGEPPLKYKLLFDKYFGEYLTQKHPEIATLANKINIRTDKLYTLQMKYGPQ